MKEITPKEVEKLLKGRKPIHLIDVREEVELKANKIPGVRHIPLGLLEEKLHELDKNKEYIMICRSGNRSGKACELLERNGIQAMNMVGGMLAWEGEVE